jgi:hypothetical protein
MSSTLFVILALVAFCQAAILGAGVYEAVSVVPNWRHAESLAAHRQVIKRRHPGHFFQVAVPVTVVILVVALILSVSRAQDWRYQAVALGSLLAAEAFTLIYFFPRNRQLLFEPVEEQPGERSRGLVRQWERANVLRLLIQVPGVAASLIALGALS